MTVLSRIEINVDSAGTSKKSVLTKCLPSPLWRSFTVYYIITLKRKLTAVATWLHTSTYASYVASSFLLLL